MAANQDLFRRLSAVMQDDEPVARADEVQRITHGRTYVYRQAAWAADLLQDLTANELTPGTRMPRDVLTSCEALGFINAQKGGFGITGGYGYGFLIKRLKQKEDGTSTWSPPFFFTVTQAGLGLSAGYQHSQTVMALVSQAAIDRFAQGCFMGGSDMGFYSTDGALTGMAAGVLGLRQQRSKHEGFSYSLVKGAYTEYAVHGTRVAPDTRTNSTLYEGASGPDVLAGLVTREFPETSCLVDAVNALAAEAAAAAAAAGAPLALGRASGATDQVSVEQVSVDNA